MGGGGGGGKRKGRDREKGERGAAVDVCMYGGGWWSGRTVWLHLILVLGRPVFNNLFVTYVSAFALVLYSDR